MLLYRIICLVLFAVIMSTLVWVMKANGEWGHGFAWGGFAGVLFGIWVGGLERKEKRAKAMAENASSEWPPEEPAEQNRYPAARNLRTREEPAPKHQFSARRPSPRDPGG